MSWFCSGLRSPATALPWWIRAGRSHKNIRDAVGWTNRSLHTYQGYLLLVHPHLAKNSYLLEGTNLAFSKFSVWGCQYSSNLSGWHYSREMQIQRTSRCINLMHIGVAVVITCPVSLLAELKARAVQQKEEQGWGVQVSLHYAADFLWIQLKYL